MEKVADWQLSHPCAFDLRWRQPGNAKFGHIRIDWDGTVLRRREIAPQEAPQLSAAWNQLVLWTSGDVPFGALPTEVRAAWQREVGLDSAALVSIKPLDEGSARGWEMAVLYDGLSALAVVSPRKEYTAALEAMGTATHWTLGPRIYHADDLAVGQLYLDRYMKKRGVALIADTQARMDWIIAHPSTQTLDIRQGQERWSWCDALFMAAPVWLRMTTATSDRRYLTFMDREWWATVEFLYSKSDRLFYRDAKFFDRTEPNGAKVFWTRGNAWVLAALAEILPEVPEDWPSRERYLALFRDLAARLVELQPPDGLWRTSLLDTTAFPAPEVSASALVCYALARGINRGWLDRDHYRPIAQRTWNALLTCVDADGHLGYVQQPGAAPGEAAAHSTAPYGVGAFLMVGSEIILLSAAGR